MNGVFMNGVSSIIFSRISFSYTCIIILFIGYTLRVTSVLTIVNIFLAGRTSEHLVSRLEVQQKYFLIKMLLSFSLSATIHEQHISFLIFFFKHQLPFIKFLWTILVIVQLKKLCKLLDTHVFILTAIHMRYTQKTWFECLMYLYGKDKIA